MSKLILINIGEGNFAQGFPVSLQIAEEGKLFYQDYQDRLPPIPKLPDLYWQWQQKYYGLESIRRVIKVAPNQITNVSTENCEEAAKALEGCLKEWFGQRTFLDLRRYVLDEVEKNESARVIFQTQDELLRKLPWHLWDLFEYRRYAEFSISAKYAPPTPLLKKPIKILAILGNNEGIDITKDEEILKRLPGAKVTLLNEPKREELNNNLWDKPWDILFFAGHSSSQEGGRSGVIQLNETDSLSLRELKHALTQALNRGLKLAIFNSCDGLGLANELVELQIPQVIVMREPVPDRVAQKFLRYFLEYFSSGEAFYIAVQKARKKLQGMEGEFPCASWLPVICQNPAENSPIWPRSAITIPPRILRWFLRNKTMVSVGGAIATAILIVVIWRWPGNTPDISNTPTQTVNSNVADHISLGEKRLHKQNTNSDDIKNKGILAFSNEEFDDAIKYFIDSLHENKNDPETLIYLNNAIAQQRAITNTGEKLVIAASVSISEDADNNVANETLRGVAQLQSELNCGFEEIVRAIDTQNEPNCQGGINGKLLQVKIADDKYEPDFAAQIAEAFVNDPGVLGVIGHHSSEMTQKAGRIYDKKELVAISSTSTAVNLTTSHDYLFRTTPSDAIAAQDLFNYMQKELGSSAKVAVAYHPGNRYSESLKNEFRKLLPSKEFVFECDLSQQSLSTSECVNQAQQEQAKALLIVPDTKKDLDKAVGIVNNNNNNGDLMLLGGDAMYNRRTVIDSGEAAVNRLVIAVPWHNPSSEFARKAEPFWGAVNWRTATAYDATQAIVEALTRINGNPDRQQLRQVLSSPDFSADGATGKVEFEPSGDRKHSPNVGVLVQVQPNQNPENPDLRHIFTLLE